MLPPRKLIRRLLLTLPGFEALCRRLSARHVRVLMYHRFRDDGDVDPRALTPHDLRAHCRLIRRHHPFWTPDAQLAATQTAWPAGARAPVVITVDDGYVDFHRFAFPVFRELGVPVTLFLTTGFADGVTWMWWDRLRHIIEAAPAEQCATTLAGCELALDLRDAAGRESAWNAVADRLRFLPDPDLQSALAALAERLGAPPPPAPPARFAAVGWDDVREMARAGVTVGAHTHTHPILTRLSREDARREIETSRDRLTIELGVPPRWFGYPQGGPADYDDVVVTLVRQAGFAGAYVGHPPWGGEGTVYTLPRYSVGADRWDLRWYLCGADHLWLALRRRAGRPAHPPASYWSGSA